MKRTNRSPLNTYLIVLAALIAATAVASTLSGCGGTTAGNPTVDTSASEIAESSLSGAANATEPSGTHASYRLNKPVPNPGIRTLELMIAALSPVQSSFAATSCPTIESSSLSSCSSGLLTLNYSDCNFGLSLTVWNGTQTIDYSPSCPASLTQISDLSGHTITRTFGTGTTETTILGVATTLDTASASGSGWDSSISVTNGGEQSQYTDAGGDRTLSILGLHLHAVSATGSVLYDHTVSTSSGIAITGHGITRAIASGTVTVEHNLAKYTAQAQITTSLLYTRAACCHPDSGVITSTLTGSTQGTETLTFTGATTGKCGTATLVSASGTSTDITLSHCF